MKNINLLIVEDDEFTRKILKEFLSKFFENIFVASNGQEGLEIFKDKKIDLIITDIEMPVLNGIEMMKVIRKINPFVPVIATTAYDDKNLLKELIDLQFDGYLQKPIDIGDVIKKIEKILDSEKYNFYKEKYIDSLTKCKNRKFFKDKYKQILNKSKDLYLLFIDLNEFKQINDNFGHSTGDEVLMEFTKRLTGSIRRNDECIRIGGDEFIVLIDEINSIEDLIKRILNNCCFNLNGVNVSCSIGIAHYPTDTKNDDELFKLADKAMYKAKEMGKCKYYYAENL